MERYEKADEKRLERPKWLFLKTKWHRIILDEAHTIKNRTTKVAQGVCALEARCRWCLTGTPMQNTIEDIYSLIAFLRIPPYCDWKSFQTAFIAPIKKGYDQKRGMRRLQALLTAILLRRTKESEVDGVKILEDLPPKSIVETNAAFGPEQEEFYRALETGAITEMKKYRAEGNIGKNIATIFGLLLRLRQACIHPWLIKEIRKRGIPDNKPCGIAETSGVECSLCSAPATDPVAVLPCRHGV